MLSFAAICPHPPILIPDIGGEEVSKVKKTGEAMESLAEEIKKKNIETVLVISPHGTVFMDAMSVNLAEPLVGDFADFQSDIELEFQNDSELAIYIKNIADSNDLSVQTVSERMDHGALVPLYFLAREMADIKVCHISFSYLDYGKHFGFGEIIYEAIQNTDRKIAIIASGDLSHRLTPEAPAGYSPSGKVFDELLIKNLEENNVRNILNMNSELIENAGECGLRSIIILLGALSNSSYKFEKMSYEGPFGVGYMVGRFEF